MYSTKKQQLKSDKKQVDSDCFLQHEGEKIALSETEYQTIQELLNLQRKGKSVTIVSLDKYMIIQEAADFLNMSRPYLIKILENQEIPYIKVGNRRKILTEDIIKYQKKRDKSRRQIMKNFSQGLKEDGLYD
jgi:excisionase family DNA binding protein